MGIHPQRKPKRQTGKTEWPKMLYDKDGNGKVFQTPDDAPEGFITRDELLEGKSAAKSAAKSADKPADDNPNKGLARKLGLKKQEIVAALTEAEIEFPADAGVDDLAAIYQAAAEAEDAEDGEEEEDAEDGEEEEDEDGEEED